MTFRLQQQTEAWFIANAGAFHSDPVGFNTFAELQGWAQREGLDASMPIYDVFDADNVFSNLLAQQAFQAWHDRRHVALNKHFTLADEHALAVEHIDTMLSAGLPFVDAVAIYFHVFGRNLYYFNHGHTAVAKVGEFVEDVFARGLPLATA